MDIQKNINVSMANMAIGKNNDVIKTSGVGSCVVITMYDPNSKIGGLAHAMLPTANIQEQGEVALSEPPSGFMSETLSAKYADQAVELMVQEIEKLGGKRANIRAKLIGGARMFKILSGDDFGIGYQNVESAKNKLLELGISVESEDTGGTIGRTVEINLENGLVSVSSKI